MTRKLYESDENLGNERAVALFIEELWICDLIKLPIKYGLDYTFRRNKNLVGFCEIKCVNYEMSHFDLMSGGYFINVGKIMSARALVETTKLPFYLIVDTRDGIWYREFTEFNNLKLIVNGRKDRDDWQDIEPMVLLETALFKRIANKPNDQS